LKFNKIEKGDDRSREERETEIKCFVIKADLEVEAFN
jgi:hypothetical protein